MGTIIFQELIRVPYAYPGESEFIALATRMRMVGAWDPDNDHYVWYPNKRLWYYSSFLRDCVGFSIPADNHGEAYHMPYPQWVTADVLSSRGFRSHLLTRTPGGYMIGKDVRES